MLIVTIYVLQLRKHDHEAGSLYPAVCVGDVTSKAGMYVKSTNYVTNLASSSSFYFILVYFLLFLAGGGGRFVG